MSAYTTEMLRRAELLGKSRPGHFCEPPILPAWLKIAGMHWLVRHAPCDESLVDLFTALGVDITVEQYDRLIDDAHTGIEHLDEICKRLGVLPENPDPIPPLEQLARMAEE